MLLRVLVTVVGAAAVVAGACVLVNPSLASSEGAARADRRLASHGTQRIAFDVTGKDDLGVIYIMRTDGAVCEGWVTTATTRPCHPTVAGLSLPVSIQAVSS